MLPFAKFHSASLVDLHTWSTLSRNEVRAFLARFGIQPLGARYPMPRIYENLLGLSPANPAEDDMLGGGLVRVTKVAGWFGVSGDDLLNQLRVPNNEYPPLFAFGPKRHLMLRAQVEQLLSSPKNAFHNVTPIPAHALPASRLARTLEVRQSKIDALLANKDDLPARIISRGRVHYIVSDVAFRLADFDSNEDPGAKKEPKTKKCSEDPPEAASASTGGASVGLFSSATKRAADETHTPKNRTGYGPDARQGDCAHGTQAEAKLSET